MPWLVVVLIRLIVPLTLFKSPFWGSLLCIVADNFDVIILDFLNVSDYGPYNQVDKLMDNYYFLLMGYQSWSWQNKLAKRTNIALLVYRTIGFILYELTNLRWLLFVFPNLFENFYVAYVGMQKFFKYDLAKTRQRLTVALTVLLIPKLWQEYMLHVVQYPIYAWISEHILSRFSSQLGN